MKRVLTSTLVLIALLAAAPAQAQTSLPAGSLNQSKNALVAKFTKLGFAFGKSHAVGNGLSYDGVNAATQSSISMVTVKTGIARVQVTYPGVVGAAADAPENHLVDMQKALKTLLPNWKDGAAWLQAAQGVVVADANAGVDTSQKEGAEQVETPLLYITYENALQKETNAVAFRLTVFNVAQLATWENQILPTPEPAPTAAPLPLAAPAQPEAPVVEQAQPAPPQAQGNCDPSYPTLQPCIPIGAADLDCPEIQAKDFQVLPPDRHGFDRDKDGIGCES